MKNWLCYTNGFWQWTPNPVPAGAPLQSSQRPFPGSNDEGTYVWVENGFCYIDPAAVTAVSEHQDNTPQVVIAISCGQQVHTRQRSAKEVIADIQSALA